MRNTWTCGVVVGVVALGCWATAADVHWQSNAGTAPYPPPGRLVDIGGWRLHLDCTGEPTPGRPTVVLEAGVGDFSVEWTLVQPGVARFARVCSYDRAGDGWSDLGPHPRTFRQIVYELHTLLERAGERGPYILVGHSYGGWLARLYQSTHPGEVAGMVLVDAGADDPQRIAPDGKVVRSSDLVTGRAIPAVKTSGPLRVSDIPPGALDQMQAGLADASRRANEPPRDKLPKDAQLARTWALGQLGHVAAAVNPFEIEELAALRTARAGKESLGDLPLIVITRGKPEDTGPDAAAADIGHRKDHARIAALSRRGKQIIATNSGHHVQIEQPDLVIQAVQDLIARR